MIVSIKPELFDVNADEVQIKISKVIDSFFENKFIWDVNNIDQIFFSERSIEETVFYKNFLSKYEQETILERVQQILGLAAYQTELHNTYLTKIVIGLNENEIHPAVAVAMLENKSVLIFENGINDFKFLKGVLKKYRNRKARRNIYKLIEQAIATNQLIDENAGGIGNILHRKENLENRDYKNIFKYKAFIIFDSDRDSDSLELKKEQSEQKKIIRELKDNQAIQTFANCVCEPVDKCWWHMLYKRGIENYLPITLITGKYELPEDLKGDLEQMTEEEIDIYKYEELIFSRYFVDIKNDFPELFINDWSVDLVLLFRCTVFERFCHIPLHLVHTNIVNYPVFTAS